MTHDTDLADPCKEYDIPCSMELCTAYYTPRNEMNKRELMNLVNATGILIFKLTVRATDAFSRRGRRFDFPAS